MSRIQYESAINIYIIVFLIRQNMKKDESKDQEGGILIEENVIFLFLHCPGVEE